MSLMVWGPKDVANNLDTIKIPQSIVTKWYDHSTFGERFKELYHMMEKEFVNKPRRGPLPGASPWARWKRDAHAPQPPPYASASPGWCPPPLFQLSFFAPCP